MLLGGFELSYPPLALVAGALVVTYAVSSWMQRPSNLPPFPGMLLPILGHMHLLGGDFRVNFLEFKKRAGEIFCVYFGGYPVVFFSGYEVLKEALVKKADIFTERPIGGPVLILESTGGIISNSGPEWKKNRTVFLYILKDFFRGKDVMSNKIMEEVDIYINDIAALNGEASDVHQLTSCAVSNITCNFLYGKRFESKDPFFHHFIHQVDELMRLCAMGSPHQWFPYLKYLPGDFFSTKILLETREEVLNCARKMIKVVKDRETDDMADCNMVALYLEKMAEAHALGQYNELNDNHLVWTVIDVMVGGSETTSTTLAWFYLYILHHPHVQEKIYEEISRELGTSRAPTSADRIKLDYVNAAILETQRMSSISPLGIFHRASEEATVGGYTIPKDAYIVTHLDSVLSDEKLWGDPSNFRPERFIKNGKMVYPGHLIPFGMGRRECPGEPLAKMELFLFIVSVMQRFQIVAADPDNIPPTTYTIGGTCPPTPYKMRFVARDTD